MSAKEIIVKPISSSDAARIVKACHYSGKVVQKSQLHFGVFLNGRCGGAMQFGPSLDKRKIQGLVEGTAWNNFIELNRMAFADWLPRNSESRAIAVAMRLMRKHYPNIEWVISFADATQCGDGTIYRASGFVLTGIRENQTLCRLPDGRIVSDITFQKGEHILKNKGKAAVPKGTEYLPGFQLRYIYFINPEARKRLTVPIIPFDEIAIRGAAMYRGKPISRGENIGNDVPGFQSGKGGATPTSPLHFSVE